MVFTNNLVWDISIGVGCRCDPDRTCRITWSINDPRTLVGKWIRLANASSMEPIIIIIIIIINLHPC